MKRQTYTDRSRIKTELSQSLDLWVRMSDKELNAVVALRAPALNGTLDRGKMLKFLVMDKLDAIN
jgi:hypothetical protein